MYRRGLLLASDVDMNAKAVSPWARLPPEEFSILMPHLTYMCRWVTHASQAAVHELSGEKHALKENVFVGCDRKLNNRVILSTIIINDRDKRSDPQWMLVLYHDDMGSDVIGATEWRWIHEVEVRLRIGVDLISPSSPDGVFPSLVVLIELHASMVMSMWSWPAMVDIPGGYCT